MKRLCVCECVCELLVVSNLMDFLRFLRRRRRRNGGGAYSESRSVVMHDWRNI